MSVIACDHNNCLLGVFDKTQYVSIIRRTHYSRVCLSIVSHLTNKLVVLFVM